MASAKQIYNAVHHCYLNDIYPSARQINLCLDRYINQSLNGRECNIRRVCLDIFGIKLRKNQYK